MLRIGRPDPPESQESQESLKAEVGELLASHGELPEQFGEQQAVLKRNVDISLESEELELLSAKMAEVLTQAALAHERIVKDQGEIELLKTETRALLTRLRAA
jgi:hypothetical protein